MEELNFVAIYNETGQIIEIKPCETASSHLNKIKISEEMANMLISGKIGIFLQFCFHRFKMQFLPSFFFFNLHFVPGR